MTSEVSTIALAIALIQRITAAVRRVLRGADCGQFIVLLFTSTRLRHPPANATNDCGSARKFFVLQMLLAGEKGLRAGWRREICPAEARHHARRRSTDGSLLRAFYP
jgi:hypothetical protein